MRLSQLEPGTPYMSLWRMRIACWITKATDTHSEYVNLIVFPRQELLKPTDITVAFLRTFDKILSYRALKTPFLLNNYLCTYDTHGP
jgi:hypothetical protein